MSFNLEGNYEVYEIGPQKYGFPISKVSSDNLYRGDHSYRKAVPCRHKPDESQKQFKDPYFNLVLTSEDTNELRNRLQPRRLYEIYDKEFNFLVPEHMEDLPIKPQKFYPTFISEFSMIDKDYLSTLFMTKILNEKGLYRYFVRRNGQYHVEVMDDWIPVDPDNKLLPPWGLSENEPWKLLLMKAWIKEKGSIKAVLEAEPYEFIDAFGFPGYRAISIHKEIDYLTTTSRLDEKIKIAKEKRIPLDIPGYVIVGKTRNNPQVEKIGLVSNRAGYRILKTNQLTNQSILKSNLKVSDSKQKKEENLYKIKSSLPSAWVGEYSLFANGKIQQPNVNKVASEIKNIENQFFATYTQISQVFSKFYICPEYVSNKLSGQLDQNSPKSTSEKLQAALIQDSMSMTLGSSSKPFFFFELKVGSSGFLNLNIELPHDSGQFKKEGGSGSMRYSYISYFMARKGEKENEQNLQGYEYYDGEYVKGYHKSVNRFLKIETAGTYYIYFKVDRNKKLESHQSVAINLNSNAKIQSFKKIDHRNPYAKYEFIMKSTLHNYNMRYGLKTYVGKSKEAVKSAEQNKKEDEASKRNLVVYVSHSFDDNSFGLISIVAKPSSTMSLAMNIDQNLLKREFIDFVPELQNIKEEDEDRIINFSAKEGQANIAILERTIKSRQKDEKFPPEDSVDFYYIL